MLEQQLGVAKQLVFRSAGLWGLGGVGGSALLVHGLAEAGCVHSPSLVAAALCGGALVTLGSS